MESVDTFYRGALQRTGTLYEGARHGVQGASEGVVKTGGTISEAAKGGLKRSGTILEGAKNNILKRTGTISLEGAREGFLKRTGTISLGGAKDGLLKRTGTISQGAMHSLQKTGTYLGGAKDGLVQRTGSWSEWVTWGKGIYSPELALNASFREITGVALPRAHHSISVINGRAYIFGGESAVDQLADNDMHVVILPSSSVLEADYKSIPARPMKKDGPVPNARKCHTAVIVENEIYIFGGKLSPKAKEEAARVWVFDTIQNRWSFHDPKPDSPYPPPRFSHAAVASDQLQPQHPTENLFDQAIQEVDPSKTVPEPPESDSWGTMFIYGGKAMKEEGEEILNDAWAFDVATRNWLPLPPPPGPARFNANLTLSENRLFRTSGQDGVEQSGTTVDFLDVGQLFVALALGKAFNKLALPTLLSEWTTTQFNATTDDASVTEVAAAGRRFLLSISSGAKSVTAIDITAAGGLRLAGIDTPESEQDSALQEVVVLKVQYVDVYGHAIEVDSDEYGRRTFDQHISFASAPGTEVDAASVVVWGGEDNAGNLLGNGWLVMIE